MKKTIEKVICDRCGVEITTKEIPPHVVTEIFISKMGDYCPKCTEDLTAKLAELFDKKIERKTEDDPKEEQIQHLDSFSSGGWTYIVNGQGTKHNSLQEAINAAHKDLETMKSAIKLNGINFIWGFFKK